GAIDDVLAGGGFLPLRRVDRNQLDVAAAKQALADLQAGRSDFAVDEDFRCHIRCHVRCPLMALSYKQNASLAIPFYRIAAAYLSLVPAGTNPWPADPMKGVPPAQILSCPSRPRSWQLLPPPAACCSTFRWS